MASVHERCFCGAEFGMQTESEEKAFAALSAWRTRHDKATKHEDAVEADMQRRQLEVEHAQAELQVTHTQQHLLSRQLARQDVEERYLAEAREHLHPERAAVAHERHAGMRWPPLPEQD